MLIRLVPAFALRQGGPVAWLLILCVLCLQSLSGVMPVFGRAHHHAAQAGDAHDHGDHAEHADHDDHADCADPHDHADCADPAGRAHHAGLDDHAGPHASTTTQGHLHASIERHHHSVSHDGDDSPLADDEIDRLLDDLTQRLSGVGGAIASSPPARAALDYAPVRVAHPGTRLPARAPGVPFRPPIA